MQRVCRQASAAAAAARLALALLLLLLVVRLCLLRLAWLLLLLLLRGRDPWLLLHAAHRQPTGAIKNDESGNAELCLSATNIIRCHG
jgi:hypothetical protein